jgi:hypothetical protein
MDWNFVIDSLINQIHASNQTNSISENVDEYVNITVVNEAPYYSLHLLQANTYIHLESFWRYIHNNKVVLSYKDNGQLYGRKEPVNIETELKVHIEKTKIIKIEITRPVNDLQLHFSNGGMIEILTDSCGYEIWNLNSNSKSIICQGGGTIAIC